MCGIAGFINKKNEFNESEIERVLNSFKFNLKHRGPDSDGIWKDNDDKIYFAHTRLSINDLSEKGSQPMKSKNNSFVLVFNGEIYNHWNIRKSFLNKFNINWEGTSDTETLLKSIEFLGIEKSLNLLEGMFAFAFYDKLKKKLYLARDKFGEKPLFYGVVNNSFVFGSELKIFSRFPNFKKKISTDALSLFLKYSYVPEPYSIYEKVFKVRPGEYLEINLNEVNINNDLSTNNLKKFNWYKPVYSLQDSQNEKTLIDKLDKILIDSVEESLISDVEVGSFLSGGLDSSIISSITQKLSKKKVKTFSICFDDENYNEQKYSQIVSKNINSDHRELVLNSSNIFNYVDKLCDVYDEPFADSSQIPTLLISEYASREVKVCLTGDGADELFGGYNRYLYTNKILTNSKYIPQIFKNLTSSVINNTDYKYISSISNLLRKIRVLNIPQLDEKIQKFGRIFNNSNDLMNVYLHLIEVSSNKNLPIFNYTERSKIFLNEKKSLIENKSNQSLQDLLNLDQTLYLTGDILHKVDRAAMNFGLETRLPYLNSKVVNFANSIDLNLKINKKGNKYILKELAKKHIPSKIINRSKMGFSVPLDKWINSDFKNISREINLNKEFLINTGFDYEAIQKYLTEHSLKKKNWSHLLWNLIIFNKWALKYII